MQRKFLVNLSFLLVLNLLIKPFYILGIDRAVQNAVGAEAYGMYYAIFNFTFLFNILLDFGITNFNNRNISQNQQLVGKHFSSIMMLRMMLAIGYGVVTLLVGWLLGYTQQYSTMIVLLTFCQVMIAFILYLRSNISALHLFRTDSLISILDRSLMILVCGVLLWGLPSGTKFQIEWFVYAQVFAYSVSLIVTLATVIVKSGTKKLNWNPQFNWVVLRESMPYALLILLMTFYSRLDTVMIEQMLDDGATQAGIYAQAFRLFDAINIVAFLFAGLLLPIFSRMLKLNESTGNLVRLSFTLLFVPALGVALVAAFYSRPIMEMLYIQHAAESAPVLGLLMFCFVATATTYIFGTLLTAGGRLRQLNKIALASVVGNFMLNYFLIPKYQAEGAAFASLCTQGVSAIAQVLLAVTLFRFSANVQLLWRLGLFSVLAIAIVAFSHMYIDNLLIGAPMAFVLVVLTAVLLRIWDVAAMITVIRTER